MKPPMHDPVTWMPVKMIDGKEVKDDQGFPTRDAISVIGRVTEESTYITDERGETVQASHTVILPNTCKPVLGDEIQVESKTVKVLKVSARKSYSGKKTFYWVTNCGT